MTILGIIGATGAVGEEMLRCLADFGLPITRIRLAASAKSTGKIVPTYVGNVVIEELNDAFFDDMDYVLFSAGGDISRTWIPRAVAKGVRVIDNSSAFRYEPDVPLVIPSINSETIGDAMIIANPNCTTAIALMPIYPIYRTYGIRKMIVSTYQATSGAGAKGMHELLSNTEKYFRGESPKIETFVADIAFNLIPHIDKFQENGYTKEEMKVAWETRKILGDDTLSISCTAVRIPTIRAHSESIVLETEKPIDIEDIRTILEQSYGVDLMDDTEKHVYPMPRNASGKYNVEVGRIRKNPIFGENGLELFISGDQLLRGAALNAVEILQYILTKKIGISAL